MFEKKGWKIFGPKYIWREYLMNNVLLTEWSILKERAMKLITRNKEKNNYKFTT